MGLDMLAFLGILIFIAVFAGAILSFFQQQQITAMQKEIASLKQRLATLSASNRAENLSAANEKPQPVVPADPPVVTAPADNRPTPGTTQHAAASKPADMPSAIQTESLFSWLAGIWNSDSGVVTSLKENGLLWLGGMVLAVGGIFLANYSIEAGLVSAEIRVALGGIFGIGLVVFAEYLSRHRARFSIYSPTICAALASSGVITCYAIILVAYEYYQFIAPLLAFVLLALVSFGATSLSIRFGPLLALIGIAGAYSIPALVATGSPNITTLLVFVSAVSLSGIWVAQQVKQNWPWYVSLTGHFIWAMLALEQSTPADIWLWLVFSVFSIYLFVLTQLLGWRLEGQVTHVLSVRTLLMPRKEQLGVLLPVLLLECFLFALGTDMHIWLTAGVLAVMLLWPPSRHSALDSWPGLLLITSLVHLLWFSLGPLSGEIMDAFAGKYLYVQVVTISVMAYCLYMARTCGRPAYYVYLVAYPVALYGASYVITPTKLGDVIYKVWAVELAVLAIGSAIATIKSRAPLQQLSFAILANACLTLCFTMLLNAATLSFALALQVASMTLLSVKYKIALPDWVYKVLLTLVLVRITAAPWLSSYSDERIFSVHWTAIIYPLIFVVLAVARRYNPSQSLKVWLEGALLHVVALMVTTEPSYWLTGDYPSLQATSYPEAVLLALSWCSLAMAYWYRATLATSMTKIYHIAGGILLIGAVYLHLDISVSTNPFIVPQPTGDNRVFNWLMLQWLVPAIVLSSVFWAPLQQRLNISAQQLRALLGSSTLSGLGIVAGLFASLYITSVIRGLFHQGNLLLEYGVKQGELYTYSVVWLLVATATIFVGQYLSSMKAVKIGFGILAVVILKAFVIDMAHLTGLYRALSFIGLGLSLVGIGWLFQKLRGDEQLAS